MVSADDMQSLAEGRHPDPFALLGPHSIENDWQVLTFQPQADTLSLVHNEQAGESSLRMERVDDRGLFVAKLPDLPEQYEFEICEGRQKYRLADPYRYGSQLTDLDEYLLAEGTHHYLYRVLGSHCTVVGGVQGVNFALWAPNALAVCVTGDFNAWHPCRHPMRKHPGSGVFELFVPHAGAGDLYQYRITGSGGEVTSSRSDPLGQDCEHPPAKASRVHQSNYVWGDDAWMQQRDANTGHTDHFSKPMSIYEIHLGSWQRDEDGNYLTYRELAHRLIPYLQETGFTHVEFMPIAAHPFDGSWGYQPIGLFSPDPRYGTPDDCRYLIDQCHQNDIVVIVDWVGAHFPRDPHGLIQFDGTCLYEHHDPKQSLHPDWDTLEYNFGRREVANFLIASAVFWVQEMHVDMLRLDAVASMLYLDYSREPGDWVANQYGGNENLQAVDFIRHLNRVVHSIGGTTIAEESTDWPMVTRPDTVGGLGFSYKWNLGWMNDSLSFISRDPIHRKHHHQSLTFGLMYTFHENFVLPLSHDEVVHCKGSIFTRMPGNTEQQFANVRLFYSFQFAYPGKKLLFMGNEFAQQKEWSHTRSLDWSLLEDHRHNGIKILVSELNRFYKQTPAFFSLDHSSNGFQWLVHDDVCNDVFAFVRYASDESAPVVAVFNFTPQEQKNYRLGVPQGGVWVERLNTDSACYSGHNCRNNNEIHSQRIAIHQQPYSLSLTLPGLTGLYLQPEIDDVPLNETIDLKEM